MSSRAPRALASDGLPPSYTGTITPGPEYPPSAPKTNPIAAPVPRVQVQDAYNFALGPNANANVKGDGVQVDVRQLMVARTPSPTPSEKYVLTHKSRSCDLRRTFDLKNNPRQILSLALTLAVVALLLLFLVYQRRIEDWLRPAADWMHETIADQHTAVFHSTPGGWLIPIAVMFVLSFPPLFGHEIIAVLCGDVWGVGIGFGIVAAGTVLGELGNFFVFKHWCKTRAKKMEETNLKYALLAQVVRDGGFKIPVVMRFSAIPGHLVTAVFSTLGMGLWTFLAAAVLGLPKQLVVVYIGVSSSDPESAKKTKIIKAVVIMATALVTHFAMWYIYRKMDEAKEGVVYRRRKARQAKVLAAAGYVADGTLPTGKALDADADLERAAGADLEGISLRTVPSATNAHVNVSPSTNTNTNPFWSSRDTVASAAAVTAQGAVRGQTGNINAGATRAILTAVFSTRGMNFWISTTSAALLIPKQLAVVFIGVSGNVVQRADRLFGHHPARSWTISERSEM
ncbi:hypothetical protein V8D89_001820 [Ganoderma adspersum]